eukprot:493690-Lingulodinium_polyedra.AAC.1
MRPQAALVCNIFRGLFASLQPGRSTGCVVGPVHGDCSKSRNACGCCSMHLVLLLCNLAGSR